MKENDYKKDGKTIPVKGGNMNIKRMNLPKMAKISQNWLDILVLFSFDYNKRYSVKELANLVGIPQRTTSRYLDYLNELNLIDSKTIGRTRVFSLDTGKRETFILINLIESYKALSYKSMPDLWIILDDFMQFGDIVLFGSYAKGYFTEDSDIDLLILSKRSKKAVEHTRLYSKDINIHFSTLNSFEKSLKQKNTLAIEIVRSHVVFGSADFIKLCWRYYRNEL